MLCDSEQLGSCQWITSTPPPPHQQQQKKINSNNNMMIMPPTTTPSSSSAPSRSIQQQQQQPPTGAAPLKCPRCDSSNTKFCYYNNYSLSQPRHFCKACKRYWTRGGTLRNVPVGGGCRKNKRVKKTHPTTAAAAAATISQSLAPTSTSALLNTNPDLSSIFYGYDPLGLINTTLAPPPYNNLNSDQFQAASLLMSSLKQPVKLEEQYPSFLPYNHDHGSNLGILKVEGGDNSLMGCSNNLTSSGSDNIWPTNLFDGVMNGTVPMTAAAATDSSYFYWNPAVGDA